MILVDIFDDIVASMRATGSITANTPSGTNTICTSVNTLTAGEVISMDSVDYVVLTASSSQFTVSGTVTASTWAALAPYYEYGHPLEISNILSAKTKNETKKYQKYPLIAFYTDVKIKHGDPFIYGKLERQFMSILGQSVKEHSSKQRYANVIKPILIPLYKTLVKKIQISRFFTETNPELKHDENRRPFWGSADKYSNVKNIFNDDLDGIDMDNISLKLRSGIKC